MRRYLGPPSGCYEVSHCNFFDRMEGEEVFLEICLMMMMRKGSLGRVVG